MRPPKGSATGPQPAGKKPPSMKFTQRRMGAQCPSGRKDVLKFDGHLGVRVTNAGQAGSLAGKFYLAQYSLAGAKRRIPLGSCDAISLAAAREATKAILGDVAKGRDPAADRKDAALRADRKAAHDALTLEALLEQWDALHLADRRERYRAESVRAIKLAFGQSLKVPAADLSRSAVVRVLDGLARDGKPAMASRTAAYGRAAYHWAVKRGSLAVESIRQPPTGAPRQARTRVGRRGAPRRVAGHRGAGTVRRHRPDAHPDRPATRGSRRHDMARARR